jgi:hypothetical protein
MAQKVQILLLDDLDGGEADETVTFALDGVTYEIDLTTGNADKLRDMLGAFTAAGRRTGGRAYRGKAPAAPTGGGNTAKIREWAKAQGYDVNDRGRIPATIMEAYENNPTSSAGGRATTTTRPPQKAVEPAAASAPVPAPAPAAKKTATAKKAAAKKTAAAAAAAQ